jgi:hypothetical protein
MPAGYSGKKQTLNTPPLKPLKLSNNSNWSAAELKIGVSQIPMWRGNQTLQIAPDLFPQPFVEIFFKRIAHRNDLVANIYPVSFHMADFRDGNHP